LFTQVGGQTLQGWLVAQQFIVGVLVVTGLYVALRNYHIRKSNRQLLDNALEHRKQLDIARNNFINEANEVLSAYVLRLHNLVEQLQGSQYAKTLNEAVRRLDSMRSKFDILSKINTYEIKPVSVGTSTLLNSSLDIYA